MTFADPAGFGLYLHLPFCRRKCPYCDFFSLAPAPTAAALQEYVGLLLRQLELAAPSWDGPVTTVFFGGGTPSLLEPAQVGALLEGVAARCGLVAEAEITLEANPGTLDLPRLAGYRAVGVNRLSLGIQSLDDAQLVRLGRLHDRREALLAADLARQAGFERLSLDLMFALPGQTPEQLECDLAGLLALEPEHLSAYVLTIEEGTPLAAGPAEELDLPGEEAVAAMFRQVHERLEAAGYHHYEISNFARPGRECRHNLATWRRRPYLGLGAGAHSFLAAGWGERRAVPPDLRRYAAQLAAACEPSESLEVFDRPGAMAETLYLGLRTAAGVAETEFRARFGCGVAEAFPGAVRRSQPRLTLHDDGHWRFDLDGWLLFDHLISHFL